MLTFCGNYAKTLFRDEKTGYTVFTVTPADSDIGVSEYGTVVCKGTIMPYGRNMPLQVTGEEDDTDRRMGTVIRVTCCREMTAGKAAAIDFLSGQEFAGIGPKTAEKILEIAGDNIFDLVDDPYAQKEIEEIPGMTEVMTSELFRKLRKYITIRELVEYCAGFGATYQDAANIAKTFGSAAMDKIKTAPYLMTMAGMPFYVCEAIAAKMHISRFNEYRLIALIFECMRLSEAIGNTYMTFSDLCTFARITERTAGGHYHTEPFLLAYTLQSRDDYFVLTKDRHIYRKTTYSYESIAAHHVNRLMRTGAKYATPHIPDLLISRIESEAGITYGPDQKKAFSLLAQSGVAIVTGGPGTGKSTLVNGLIKYLEIVLPDKLIGLCAPTGAAAKRLRETTGKFAQTIHKMIDIRPFGGYVTAKDEYDPLAYDIIIVDEVSMVDTELFCRLLKAVKNGSLLLLVGDKDQLPSVGCGNVLRDLIRSGYVPVVPLTSVYRQKGGNSIIENSARIRMGNPRLTQNSTFRIMYVQNEKELKDLTISQMEKLYDKDDPFRVRCFTPVRKKTYECGAFALNRYFHEKYHSGDESVTYGGISYSVGDPVVMTRNNYDKGYLNGDQGVVESIIRDAYGPLITVRFDAETALELRSPDMADMTLGYAVTTHKAQGAECDTAIIILPAHPANMLERSLVYVAATRAKRQNILIVQGGALEKAILTDRHDSRKTALTEMLQAG